MKTDGLETDGLETRRWNGTKPAFAGCASAEVRLPGITSAARMYGVGAKPADDSAKAEFVPL
ncbi:MAG: hypothetical protein ACJ8J0_22260 [Longimicrobiaceae bacterium]